MKSAIHEAFSTARAEGRTAFIPFMTGGFPDPDTCGELLSALDGNGADIIEVGIPFSDPLADGPTIQAAGKKALDNGATPAGVLDFVARMKARLTSPIVIMTYVNPVLRMGIDEFARRAADAGVSGVIIPDLPPEEAESWLRAAALRDVATIFMVAPTSPPDRLAQAASVSSGFVYYVSMTGVTGTDMVVSDKLIADLDRVGSVTSTPVAVGFGVSTTEQAGAFAGAADGVIVGSALIRTVLEAGDPRRAVKRVRERAAAFRSALGNGSADDRSNPNVSHHFPRKRGGTAL